MRILLIALAAAVLPDILKAVVGDKLVRSAGTVTPGCHADHRTQIPKRLATSSPPILGGRRVRLKLAEIAAAQEEKRERLNSRC